MGSQRKKVLLALVLQVSEIHDTAVDNHSVNTTPAHTTKKRTARASHWSFFIFKFQRTFLFAP
jgi:hypothetical protein